MGVSSVPWVAQAMALANSMHPSVSLWTEAETWQLRTRETIGSKCLIRMVGIGGPWVGSEVNLANSVGLKACCLMARDASSWPIPATIGSRFSVFRIALIPFPNM